MRRTGSARSKKGCWKPLLCRCSVFFIYAATLCSPLLLAAQEDEDPAPFFERISAFVELGADEAGGARISGPDHETVRWSTWGPALQAGISYDDRFFLGLHGGGSRFSASYLDSTYYKFNIGYFACYETSLFHRNGLLPDTISIRLLGQKRGLSFHPYFQFQHLFTNATMNTRRMPILRDRLNERLFKPGIGMRMQVGEHFYIRGTMEWFIHGELETRPSNTDIPANGGGPWIPTGAGKPWMPRKVTHVLGWRF